jgi:hypothetical protein
MFDNFFKNLHYFKFKDNKLTFNRKEYYLENLDEKYNNVPLIDLYNNEELKEDIITLLYKIYQDLEIVWDKGQGYDGSKKYIDRIAYIEYFDERLNEFRRSTVKNFRFYDEKEDERFLLRQEKTLYDLFYA